MPFNEKLAYVESVLDVLMESRFGPGRATQLVVNISNCPELEPAVFFDLIGGEMVPCYEVSPEGRFGYQVVEAEFRKAKRMGLVGTRPNPAARSPANFGRGSP
jgi:hypothetical protein